MQRASSDLFELLEPIVSGLGFEFVGALMGQAEGGMTLRVYIDNPDGINVEDCGVVSRQLSATLDVMEPIKGHYVLEVSSPGLERPLFDARHYATSVGQRVKVKLASHVLGRKRFTGELISVDGSLIVVEVDGEHYDIDFDDIESGHIAPL